MSAHAPFPRRINVEVTNHCDQRCVLCPRSAFTRPLGFMQFELFAKIARECAAHPAALWLHFLGEPLLHRALPELVRCAKQAGVVQVGLSTNATQLCGTLAQDLLTCGLDRLECSLDADEREAYQTMRGKDDFDRVVRNVRAFLAAKAGQERPVTSIQFMRTPAVDASLARLVEAWRPYLGARDFVMTIAPAGFAGAVDSNRAAGATLIDKEAADAAHGDNRAAGAALIDKEAADAALADKDAGAALGDDHAAGAARVACPWLWSSLVILHDGTVTMCGADWDARAPLGNVRERTIAEIWDGAEMERRRALHLAGRFGDLTPCASCEDWRLADGNGYVNALEEVDRATATRRA